MTSEQPNPYLAEPSRTAELPSGIRLAYRRTGVRGGRPVVAIHGVTGSSVSFSQVDARLAELGPYDLIAVDLRGHGESDAPRGVPYSIADHVTDAAALMDLLDLRGAHLVGHSLGSFVSQELAAVRPDLVASLSLIGTAGRVVQANARLRQLIADAAAFDQFDAANPMTMTFMKDWFPDVDSNHDPAFAQAIRLNSMKAPPYAFKLAIEGVVDGPSSQSLVIQPVQIVWGTEDAFFSHDDQLDLIRRLASTVVLFQTKPGYSHDTHWERRMGEEFAEDIHGFLALAAL
jgi:pimeloyl-ACP methyl ester carboxylesterase